LFDGLITGDRAALAQSITLIESSLADHQKQSHLLLQQLIESKHPKRYFNPSKTHTLRLGIAGPPGTGKSSFIDVLGMSLIQKNHRVAVIPVDPSSHVSGGSILGYITTFTHLHHFLIVNIVV
jgi:LAO/AO transport system kinase